MMRIHTKVKTRHFTLCLNVMLIAFLSGSILAVYVLSASDLAFGNALLYGQSIQESISGQLIYYGALLACVLVPGGLCAIPVVLVIKGFAFSCTVGVLAFFGETYTEIWKICGVSSMLQMPALLYCAAVMMDFKLLTVQGFKQGRKLYIALAVRAICFSVASILLSAFIETL